MCYKNALKWNEKETKHLTLAGNRAAILQMFNSSSKYSSHYYTIDRINGKAYAMDTNPGKG